MPMRAVPALLAVVLMLPALSLGAAPDAAVARLPGPQPGQTAAPAVALAAPDGARADGPCPSNPCLDVPYVVDDNGDTMTGDLAFRVGKGIAFPGGRLTGETSAQLRYAGNLACLVGVAIYGCGDIARVEAGTGLVGGGTVGDVFVAVDFGVAQARVAGTCGNDTFLTGVNNIGGVTCRAVGRPGFHRTAIDAAGDVGQFSSIALGSDGLPLIAYRDASVGRLKMAHCSDLACRSASVTRLPLGLTRTTSLAIGSDGLGLVGLDFAELTAVSHCDNLPCTSASWTVIDNTGGDRGGNSLTIGSDGLGLLAYYDQKTMDLKVAHCLNVACSAFTKATVDGGWDVGRGASMTVGGDGLGLISYFDGASADLKVAHCSDLACSSATTSTIDAPGHVGMSTSIAVGSDGLGIVAYLEGITFNLKVAHCDDAACTTATNTTLDALGAVGASPSITIGSDGLALIAYHDLAGALKVGHCSDVPCTKATVSTLDGGDVGVGSSLTLGADGLGIASYYDQKNGDLKVVHLSNRLGVPYHRPR